MTWTRFRRRRRGRGDSGAVAVEAAIIVPVLMLVTFGIVEWALVMRDNNSANAMVRDAGRTASITNPNTAWIFNGITFPNVPAFAPAAADAAENSGAVLPKNSVQELWVFQPAQTGSGRLTQVFQYPEGNSASTPFASCTTNCIRFRWNEVSPPGRSQFLYIGGAWDPGSIISCQPQRATDPPTGSVGIYVKVRHSFLVSGLFGTSINLSDSAVFRFEPQPNDVCVG